jgi:hypothetical protein
MSTYFFKREGISGSVVVDAADVIRLVAFASSGRAIFRSSGLPSWGQTKSPARKTRQQQIRHKTISET